MTPGKLALPYKSNLKGPRQVWEMKPGEGGASVWAWYTQKLYLSGFTIKLKGNLRVRHGKLKLSWTINHTLMTSDPARQHMLM